MHHIISEINMYARCGFFQYTGLAGQWWGNNEYLRAKGAKTYKVLIKLCNNEKKKMSGFLWMVKWNTSIYKAESFLFGNSAHLFIKTGSLYPCSIMLQSSCIIHNQPSGFGPIALKIIKSVCLLPRLFISYM